LTPEINLLAVGAQFMVTLDNCHVGCDAEPGETKRNGGAGDTGAGDEDTEGCRLRHSGTE